MKNVGYVYLFFAIVYALAGVLHLSGNVSTGVHKTLILIGIGTVIIAEVFIFLKPSIDRKDKTKEAETE